MHLPVCSPLFALRAVAPSDGVFGGTTAILVNVVRVVVGIMLDYFVRRVIDSGGKGGFLLLQEPLALGEDVGPLSQPLF